MGLGPGAWSHIMLASMVEKQAKLLMPGPRCPQGGSVGGRGSSRVNPKGQQSDPEVGLDATLEVHGVTKKRCKLLKGERVRSGASSGWGLGQD